MNRELAASIECGRHEESLGRPDRARAHFEAALHAVRAEDGGQLAVLMRWIGATHRAEGSYAAARDSFRASLTVARLRSEPQNEAHALNWLGILSQDRGRIDRADRLFLRAHRIAHRIGDRRTAAMVDQNLGINRNIRGEWGRALFHYRRSLRLYEAMGDAEYMAGVLNVLGMLYTDVARWPDAARAFDRAASICAARDDVRTLVMVELSRVEMLVLRNRPDAAEAALERAASLCVTGRQPAVLAEIHRWRGVIERETGRFEAAERNLLMAERLARRHRMALLLGESCLELGRLYGRQRRDREALAVLLRARQLFTGIRARRDIAEAARRLTELENAFLLVVRTWAESIEEKDEYTSGHCHRVAAYATDLARAAGFDEATIRWFQMGAYLHDVGKIEVPTEILAKPGRLEPGEMEIMKRHTIAGDAIVAGLDFPWDVRPMVRHHHEHWDGSGYPDGLAGTAIPLAARVLAVADVFDALTSDRPYREAFSPRAALAEMQAMCGRELDPQLFITFQTLVLRGAFRTMRAA